MSPRSTLAAALPLVVTLWPSRRHPAGRRSRLTWATFIARFVAAPEPSLKKEGVAGFALTSFRDDRRALSHVERVHALMFDVDDGSASIDAAVKLWRRAQAVIYTTYSSTPAHPKLRIVVALSRPVTPDEHARLWHWAARRFARAKIVLDESTKDPSRLWYLPSHPINCTTYAWRELRGRALDVESLLQGAATPVLPGPGSVATRAEARSAPAYRKDGRVVPAAETLLGRAFKHAGLDLTDSADGTVGAMHVTCPWDKRHSGAGDASSSVVYPSKSATALGHFHCLHQHCVGRTTRDVLRALPRDAVARARQDHGVEQRVRATVTEARLESRPAWDARPPLVRWRLELATRDGELLQGNITLPTAGYEHARLLFNAVFPGLRWTSKLESFSEWKRRKIVPMGLKLAITLRGSEVTSMGAAGGARRRQPRLSETARGRRSA